MPTGQIELQTSVSHCCILHIPLQTSLIVEAGKTNLRQTGSAKERQGKAEGVQHESGKNPYYRRNNVTSGWIEN